MLGTYGTMFIIIFFDETVSENQKADECKVTSNICVPGSPRSPGCSRNHVTLLHFLPFDFLKLFHTLQSLPSVSWRRRTRKTARRTQEGPVAGEGVGAWGKVEGPPEEEAPEQTWAGLQEGFQVLTTPLKSPGMCFKGILFQMYSFQGGEKKVKS